ncbi:MAG: FecR domain-containing protein [Pseudomonas sp.]
MTRDEQRQALRDAAGWLARLAEAPQDPQVHQAWQHWHGQRPANLWAWQRVESMQSSLRRLPASLACQVLDSPSTSPSRRAVLKGLLLLAGSGALGWSGYRQAPIWLAAHHTVTGERRSLTLADGTLLALNTASAVDIEFTTGERLIHLRAGEILLQTGNDPRPLSVISAQGRLRALGTRFNVRQLDGVTQVKVLEHAVAVRPVQLDAEQVVPTGMAMDFSGDRFHTPYAVTPAADAWVSGHLVVSGWPLQRLLAELSRYRNGFLGCADDVAALQLSGAFPLDDIDKALASVARALPVLIVRRTRFWTRVVAKA